MDLILEPATLEDYEEMIDVYSELVDLHVANLSWKFQRPEKEIFSKAYFEECLKSKNNLILLAKQKDKAIGLVNVKIERSAKIPLYLPRRYAKINDLVVKESFRGKGVGKKLLEEAQKWIQAKGVTDIELEVYDFNADALAFYKKDNFQEVSVTLRKTLKTR